MSFTQFLRRATPGSTRGFAAEILVIVIGVLIALGAGNVAEEWSWQRKVTAGEKRLLREGAANVRYAAEQVVVGPCLDAQLVQLRTRVLRSGDALDPAPLRSDTGMWDYVVRMPSRPFTDGIWMALNDDGTSGHMADARQQKHVAAYEQLAILQELRAESDLLSGRLMTLAHPLPLDASSRATLVADIEEQRARSRFQSLVAGQILGAYRDLGSLPSDASVELSLTESGTVAFCHKHGLPLDSWRKVMASEAPSQRED